MWGKKSCDAFVLSWVQRVSSLKNGPLGSREGGPLRISSFKPWIDEWMGGCMYGRDGRMDGWMDGWTGWMGWRRWRGWREGGREGRKDGWTDGCERNFGLTKFCRSGNSRLRNFGNTKFRWYSLWCKQTDSNANTQPCIALNRYTVGSVHSIASIAGIIHQSNICDKFHNIPTLVDNDLLRIL